MFNFLFAEGGAVGGLFFGVHRKRALFFKYFEKNFFGATG
jgi:hypothetical protein